jgi:hypothetical protein
MYINGHRVLRFALCPLFSEPQGTGQISDLIEESSGRDEVLFCSECRLSSACPQPCFGHSISAVFTSTGDPFFFIFHLQLSYSITRHPRNAIFSPPFSFPSPFRRSRQSRESEPLASSIFDGHLPGASCLWHI